MDRKGCIGYADETGKPLFVPVLPLAIPLRAAKRRLRIMGREKRSPAPMVNIGTGKVKCGITLINPGIVFNKKRPL